MRVEPPTSTTPATVVARQLGVAQRLAHRGQGALREVGVTRSKSARLTATSTDLSPPRTHGCGLVVGQAFLGPARRHLDFRFLGRRHGFQAGNGQQVVGQRAVVVVAAQRRVAAGGDDFEHAAREPQDGDVEGAAAQVVHRVDAFAGVVQPVGDGGGRRLVDQAQHLQAGQLRRVLGGLALAVVEVGRHRDDGAVQVVVERVLGAKAQRGQDLGADLHRRLLAGARLQRHHAGLVEKRYGSLLAVGDVRQAAAHEPLDRGDGVLGVLRLGSLRVEADLPAAAFQVAHHRGQQHAALRVGQAFGDAVAHGRHERVRGAQVDADRDAALVRVGSLPGFGDLEPSGKHGERGMPCPIVPAGRSAPRRHGQSAR
jgi:hypothetical protein